MPRHSLTRSLAASLCLGLPALSGTAFAHAIVLESTPSAGGSVPAGQVEIVLRYNSRIDQARSAIRLSGPAHAEGSLPLAGADAPDTLRATAELSPGAYVIRWQVLAVDGHVTRGEVRFKVIPRP